MDTVLCSLSFLTPCMSSVFYLFSVPHNTKQRSHSINVFWLKWDKTSLSTCALDNKISYTVAHYENVHIWMTDTEKLRVNTPKYKYQKHSKNNYLMMTKWNTPNRVARGPPKLEVAVKCIWEIHAMSNQNLWLENFHDCINIFLKYLEKLFQQ